MKTKKEQLPIIEMLDTLFNEIKNKKTLALKFTIDHKNDRVYDLDSGNDCIYRVKATIIHCLLIELEENIEFKNYVESSGCDYETLTNSLAILANLYAVVANEHHIEKLTNLN